MKQHYASSIFKKSFLLFLLLVGSIANAQDLTVNGTHTIAEGEREEYDAVNFGSNGSHLIVNGTLIINGDLNLNRNQSSFSMGENSRVIIYGNFEAENQVDINIAGYLFVYGDFIKGGSSGQDIVIIDEGKIYILGNVDNWGQEFSNCGGGYEGTTTDIEDDCDYGNEDDYENNQDEFPDDLVEELNCYDLSAIDSAKTWEGGSASFNVDQISGVNYQWQEKEVGSDAWINVGENSPNLTLTDLSLVDSGNEYRVKVTPQGDSDCKISISKNVMLEVNPIPQIENENPEIVCSGEVVEFSVEENENYNYSWYRSDSGGSNFFEINDGQYSGTNTATMTVDAATWMNNQNFRVEITNSEGNKAFSNTVAFQVNESPAGVWDSPEDGVVCEGSDTFFEMNSSAENIQWQVSSDEGDTWEDLQNDANYNNVEGSNLDIVETPLTFNNNLYRAKVYNENCSIYSEPASLSVNPDPISQQPQDTYAEFGDNAEFQAETQGENLNYQWQTYSSTWHDINDNEHYRGTNTHNLELIEVGYWPVDGSRFRLLVTNENGCVSISDVVFLNIGDNPCEFETTWTGAEDGNWNNPNNWNCNNLPTLESNVKIPADVANFPVVSTGANALAKNLEIETGASLEVIDNWLLIAGQLNNNGLFKAQSGSIALVGEEEQQIPANSFEKNRVQNLRANNPQGVISEGELEITGMLEVETAFFDTGDQLTLISDADQTALISGSGAGEVIGLVNMQRYLDTAFGYKYFSSPFSNSVVGDFAPYVDLDADFPNFYRYNENREDSEGNDATGWESYTNATSTLNILSGYALNLGTDAAEMTVEISGEVNNGPVSIALENNVGEYTRGFQLVGNPYPSPIDWDATSGWTKNNIENEIHFFTAGDEQYTGTYTSYINGISSTDGKASNIIPAMQGFFVKVSDGETPVNAELAMTNDVRVIDFDQQFLKSSEAPKSLIRLEAKFTDADKADAMVIYFNENSSLNFEKELDAHKMMNTDSRVPNFYSLGKDDQKLSINAVPEPQKDSAVNKIPLGLHLETAGELEISLADLENIDSVLPIYLKDNKTGELIDLREHKHRFKMNSGDLHDRFELILSEVKEISSTPQADKLFSVFEQGGELVVQLYLDDDTKGLVSINGISGQHLASKPGKGEEELRFSQIQSSGIYLVTLAYKGERYSKKVLIKK